MVLNTPIQPPLIPLLNNDEYVQVPSLLADYICTITPMQMLYMLFDHSTSRDKNKYNS